jgi:hypothetical protein
MLRQMDNESKLESYFGKQLIDKIIAAGLATPRNILGCSQEEILLLELQIGFKLPIVYREILSAIGKSAGKFFLGTDMFFPGLLKLNQYAKELLGDAESSLTLPERACVFLMHQGYQFSFFVAHDSEADPDVFYYLEDSGEFHPQEKLSKYFLDSVDEHLKEV